MTQWFVIAIGVLIGTNIVSGVMLKNSWEANATLKAVNEANAKMYEKAIDEQKRTIEVLETQRATDQQTMLALGEENNEVRRQFDKQRATFDAWRGRLAGRALERPKIAERAARIGTRRWMCDLWEASGGVRDECPSTSVSSASSGARRARASGDSSTDSGSDASAEPAGSGG